jgi:hypothetical protein
MCQKKRYTLQIHPEPDWYLTVLLKNNILNMPLKLFTLSKNSCGNIYTFIYLNPAPANRDPALLANERPVFWNGRIWLAQSSGRPQYTIKLEFYLPYVVD